MTPRDPKKRTPEVSRRRGRPKKRMKATSRQPERRRGSLRIRGEAATRIRAGHPWVFRDALRSRSELPEEEGQIVTLTDQDGRFVGSGYFEPEGAVAVKVLTLDPEEAPGPDLYRARARRAADLREALIESDKTQRVGVV